MENFEQWSDEQVLSTAVRYGEEARKWKNKFLGLLPEVEHRKLYLQKGFSSVVHFAQVVGGVSEEQVSRVLNVSRKFATMPVLQGLLTSGEVSVNKLARVASVATAENELFLADQVQMLPKSAVEVLVKEMQSVPGHKPEQIQTMTQEAIYVDGDVAEQLKSLQGKGMDVSQILREALTKREQEIQEWKKQIGESCQETDSRYVPKEVRDILQKEHGTKCSMPGCTRPSEEIHHTQRFSLSKRHDPRYMAPFCKPHHQIAHSIDLRVQEKKGERRDP